LHNFFRSQKGVTLVELLAGLALFGIVLTIVTSVLVQSIKYNERSENNVNLRQEANFIVTSLRNHKPEEKYKICLDENGDLVLGDYSIETNPSITYKDIYINQNINLQEFPNCTEKLGPRESYDIHFVLEEKEFNQTFSLTTTITKLSAFKRESTSQLDDDSGE